MKREQIKELKGMISQAVADDRMSQSCAVEIMDKLDAILALPLDVSDNIERPELILKKHTEDSQWYAPVCDSRVLSAMQEYAEAYHEAKMKEEIIKRNK